MFYLTLPSMKWRYAVFAVVFSLIVISSISYASPSGFQSSTISLPEPMCGYASVYYNGSVVLIGKTTNLGSNVIEYQGGNWKPLPPMPVDLTFPSAVNYDGDIYVFGGIVSSTGEINGNVYVFNGQSWSTISQQEPDPAYGSYSFVYNGQIYIIGGFITDSAVYYATPPSTDVRVFNPSSGTWQIIGQAPYPMGGGGYVFNGTDMIVVGGYLGGYSASYTRNVTVYDPSSNSWYQLPHFPLQVGYTAVGYLNGVVFVVGGLMFTTLGLVFGRIYYLDHGTWYRSYNYENPSLAQSSYLQVGDQLYVIGGLNQDTSLMSSVVDVITLNAPPTTPRQPVVIFGNETAIVQWNPVNYSTGYYLRLNGNGGSTTLNVGNVTEYKLTGLNDGERYSVSVMAYNQAGNSSWSIPDYFTPLAVPNPPDIDNLKLGNHNVTVDFHGPSFNGGSQIMGYYLVLSNSTFSMVVKLPVTSNNFTFVHLVNGSSYTLSILDYNSLGNSSPTTVTFVGVDKPRLSLFSFNTPNGVDLRLGFNFYSNYTIYVYSGHKLIDVENFTNVSEELIKLPFGTYKFVVMVKNPAGYANSSILVNYYLPPSVPLVFAEVNHGNLTVDMPSSSDVSLYKIYLDGKLEYNGNGTTFTTMIKPNETYNLSVIAVNPIGSSTPFTISVFYPFTSSNVTQHVTVSHNIIPTFKATDPSLPIVDSVSIIVLTISVLWIIQVILKKEAETKEKGTN